MAPEIGAERHQKHNEVLLAYLDERHDRLEALAEDARAASEAWVELHARYWLGHLLAATRDARPGRSSNGRSTWRRLKVRTMAEECGRALAELNAF